MNYHSPNIEHLILTQSIWGTLRWLYMLEEANGSLKVLQIIQQIISTYNTTNNTTYNINIWIIFSIFKHKDDILICIQSCKPFEHKYFLWKLFERILTQILTQILLMKALWKNTDPNTGSNTDPNTDPNTSHESYLKEYWPKQRIIYATRSLRALRALTRALTSSWRSLGDYLQWYTLGMTVCFIILIYLCRFLLLWTSKTLFLQ